MNEHLGHYEEPNEISIDERRSLIARVRALAPYTGQPVDQFGSYVTHYYHDDDDGFTSIYIPGLSGHIEPGKLFSDSVQVMDRRLEEEIGNISVVRVKSYVVHEADFTLEYSDELRTFDTQTGQLLQPDIQTDAEMVHEAQMYELPRRIAEFTHERLTELLHHLDTLDPKDTFQFPGTSNA